MSEARRPDVSVDIGELVLIRQPGEPLGALTSALARELSVRGVPEPEAAASEIIDGIARRGAA
jgi:hypothetical protein